ncbi:hypothetical protein [Poriferisphaera sp. WC338]|uniref:hypothetical protein n=1 Tax=Poriferisphaera sp. WC338 TaxID=3425129 RepID=UPI003D81845E
MAGQPPQSQVNPKHCTDRLRTDYAHVGLYDVNSRKAWIARKKRWDISPVRVSHARLLMGGTQDTSTVSKDQFVCYWFHPPNTGEGFVHGYPIEWDEGHLMIRLDPFWDYANQKFIAATDAARSEANIKKQINWAHHLYDQYLVSRPKFPLSLHLVGPRATDSMFYLKRSEAAE